VIAVFNIGDKISYPVHGAGVIESIEEKEVLGSIKRYYILKMPIGDIKLMVPIDCIEEFGIRYIISYEEYIELMNSMRQKDIKVPEIWSRRYKINMDKIKSGDIHLLTEVIKDLMVRKIKKSLSPGESKMLKNAEQIFYSELMLVTGLNLDELMEEVRKAASSAC
jgi:CarD family transcriptional regulator